VEAADIGREHGVEEGRGGRERRGGVSSSTCYAQQTSWIKNNYGINNTNQSFGLSEALEYTQAAVTRPVLVHLPDFDLLKTLEFISAL